MDKVYSKIFEASKKIDNIKKDSKMRYSTKHGSVESSFASLTNIIDSTKTQLEDQGLYIYHKVVPLDENFNTCHTTIHSVEDGSQIDAQMQILSPHAISKRNTSASIINICQQYGAQITFARRYNIVNLLNLNTEADTDASDINSSQESNSNNLPSNAKTSNYKKNYSVEQIEEREALLDKAKELTKGIPFLKLNARIEEVYNKKNLYSLNNSQLKQLIEKIQSDPNRQAL